MGVGIHREDSDRKSAPGHGRGSSPADVRVHNEQLVLTLVRRRGALAKAELARLTGLSPQTASVIMRKLEKTDCSHAARRSAAASASRRSR